MRKFNNKRKFLSYQDRLYGYALAITGDKDLAAELMQEFVIRVMGARRIPKDEPAYRSWLFKIIRNLWLDKVRKNKLRSVVEIEDPPDSDILSLPTEENMINIIAVRQAFETLSKDHRDILALVDVVGLSYEEAADLLEVPKGTVMSRLSRGRLALAKLLQDANVIELKTHIRRRKT